MMDSQEKRMMEEAQKIEGLSSPKRARLLLRYKAGASHTNQQCLQCL